MPSIICAMPEATRQGRSQSPLRQEEESVMNAQRVAYAAQRRRPGRAQSDSRPRRPPWFPMRPALFSLAMTLRTRADLSDVLSEFLAGKNALSAVEKDEGVYRHTEVTGHAASLRCLFKGREFIHETDCNWN